MSSPPRTDGPTNRNAPTWFPRHFGDQPPPPPPAVDLPTAYATALRLHRGCPPVAGEGYRLYTMTAAQFASRDVLAGGASFAILGRHTACDVVLAGDASIALRHVLVECTVLDDGCPRLSVLDLESDHGFLLANGTFERSIVAAGPIAFRVGAYAVVALPGGVPLPEALPVPACDRADGRALPLRAPVPVPPSSHGAPVPSGAAPMSRITLLPRAMVLSERPTLGVVPHAGSPACDYELSLASAGGRVSVYLSVAELERGLLVGRANKCLDAGLRSVLNIGISRVHLLLLRDAAGCRAYDIASTQGTYRDGRSVRRASLEDEGTRLVLGAVSGIGLSWRRMGPG